MHTEGTYRTGEPDGPEPDDEHQVRRRLSVPDSRAQGTDPPERTRQDARDAYALRRPGGAEATVAALTADSAFSTDLRAAPGLDEDGPRYLTFRGGASTVRIEVTGYGKVRDIVGQVLPGRPVEVEVHWPRGHRAPDVDTDGAFVLHGVPAGPVSLVVRDGSGEVISTRWTRV